AGCRTADQQRAPPPPAELVPVAPGGELRALRCADPDQLEPLPVPGKADLVSGDAHAGLPEDPLGRLDRLPALLDRRQVPALTPTAHHPDAAARRLARDPAADRDALEHLVRAKAAVAEEAGRVQGRWSSRAWLLWVSPQEWGKRCSRMGPGPGARGRRGRGGRGGRGGSRGRRGRRGTAGAPLTKPLTASTFPSLSAKRNVRLTAAQEIAAARANLFRPRGDPAGGRVPAFLCR